MSPVAHLCISGAILVALVLALDALLDLIEERLLDPEE